MNTEHGEPGGVLTEWQSRNRKAAPSIGEQVIAHRLLNGLSQADLARRLDMFRGNLCAIEKDKRQPSLSLLRRMAAELHCEFVIGE